MTPFVEIYAMFLNDIKDLKLTNPDLLTPEELGDILQDYLFEAADLHFRKCKFDLSDRTDEYFNSKLNLLEKRILAKAMRLKWLTSNFLANEKMLASRLTTTDYKVYSPANQLNILMNMEKNLEKELKTTITRYLYDNWIAGE